MEPRERQNEHHGPGPGSGDGGSGGLDRLRAQGNDFLAASDEAIRRALSGDSEAFLRANHQRGGQ
jgi:hypothetical protein